MTGTELAKIVVDTADQIRAKLGPRLLRATMIVRHLTVYACLLAAPAAAAEVRQELSLNGPWEYQRVAELTSPPTAGTWTNCTVPGYLSGTDYQRAWLRRTFAVPAAMRGQRIKLHFGGVKYHSRVVLNGQPVGGCFGGYEPFELDVTAAIHFNGPNELLVGCHDWTGVFTPGKVEFPQGAHWEAVRNAPRDKILSPIGGIYGLFGIWDDVSLRATPAVYVKSLFIKPSVRRGELVVDGVVANESAQDADVELLAVVEDHGQDVLPMPTTKVKIPAGQVAAVSLRQAWTKPPLWSHLDPHLLHLQTTLSSGDQLRTRFGFREFWVEGHKFFLNGARMNLLATSWWPPQNTMTREEIRQTWEQVKRLGCVAFRTHTQPWPSLHYEVADEVGLLMIPEGAVWNDDDTYRIYDPVFWQNYARHLQAMVERDRNRPSVVLWSLENEFQGGRLNDTSTAKPELVRMGHVVKQADPTRPILYESDGDPGGVADVIGIHYPHEYPDFTCWPNEAQWLERPAHIPQMFLNGEAEFTWRRDKPLYVGEFLWIPSRDPSWHTVFFGDEAYRDYHRYRNLAKAESWKMQILGYRHQEVAGISPWTVSEGGPLDETNPLWQAHRYAYQPLAAYPLEYDHRFYSGEQVARHVDVFNEALEPSVLELAWTLSRGDEVVDRGQQQLQLGPGERQTVELQLHLPQVEQRTDVTWRLTLTRNQLNVFDQQHTLTVFPRLRLATPPVTLGLWDPAGTTRRLFERVGLRTQNVATLQQIPAELPGLVIGAGTLQAAPQGVPVLGRVAPERAALTAYLQRGGRVLVLSQAAYPEGLFDVTLTKHRSTMTFPQRLHHPALRDVEAEDLKLWRGDHFVTSAEPTRPSTGAGRPVVVSGAVAGIDHAPLLEWRTGRGLVIHSQLALVEKFDGEPVAARMLSNLIEYLARPAEQGLPERFGQTAVWGGTDAYRNHLRSLGLRFTELSGNVTADDLAPCGLLICRGDVPLLDPLRSWIESGGRLWLHRLPAESLERVCRELHLELVAQPYTGAVTRAEGAHPLLEAITREDLYWLGKHVGIDWAETPRATSMTDLALARTLGDKQAATYSLDDWKLEGGIVQRQSPGVVFATNGSASQEIDFPAAGEYLIGVHARGTPCQGEYPIVQLAVDGQRVGQVSVSERWETTCLVGQVAVGKHRVSVAFINDASEPPREDRNLYVQKVLIARDDNSSGVQFLTSPAGLAAIQRGRGLVLLDQLRWDTEEANGRKAARLASSLLTELGGDFAPRLGTTIRCNQMEPQPDMPFFNNQGGSAALACNGYVKTPLEVAETGRYSLELVASGTPAQGVYPLVEVQLDGRKCGQISLTAGSWRSYFLNLELTAGGHELRLAFVNDANLGGEDRNLLLDKITFFRE
jgi:hypothetical protein